MSTRYTQQPCTPGYTTPEMDKKKKPLIYKGFGVVVTVGLEPVVRMLNRRDCPLGRSLVSHEKAADETPATGGHRRLSPIDVSHLDATGSGFITGNTKTRITARVILAFVWSVLDSNQ